MSTTVVTTASGAIGGVVDGDAIAFRGIPYAQPPFGERLWRLPEAPERWDGVLDCSGYGPICPQPALATAMLTAEPETQGEDCLRLNVWTPTLDPAGLPVMVWIHGGAYLFGSGSAPGTEATRSPATASSSSR
jgi:para-nitrobenzyl esterase